MFTLCNYSYLCSMSCHLQKRNTKMLHAHSINCLICTLSVSVYCGFISWYVVNISQEVTNNDDWALRVMNKANLRDLMAATGLVILLKLDLNRRFFSPCDRAIWWMTKKNNRAPLQYFFKLFASFRSHWWIQTGVTVRKRLIWVKIDAFFNRVTLKFEGWPSKTIGHLFYVTSSFVQHFVAIGEF